MKAIIIILVGLLVLSMASVAHASGPVPTPPPPTPIAGFTAMPESGHPPLTVIFEDASTGSPTSWQWDFGDGNTSNERNPTHTYAQGKYTVTLVVSNDQGSSSTTATIVADTTTPPPRDTQNETANFNDLMGGLGRAGEYFPWIWQNATGKSYGHNYGGTLGNFSDTGVAGAAGLVLYDAFGGPIGIGLLLACIFLTYAIRGTYYVAVAIAAASLFGVAGYFIGNWIAAIILALAVMIVALVYGFVTRIQRGA